MANTIQKNIATRYENELRRAERTENSGFAAAQTLGDAVKLSPGLAYKLAGSAFIADAVIEKGIEVAKWTGERAADTVQGNGGVLDNAVLALGGTAVLAAMGSEVLSQGIRMVAETKRGFETFQANRAARAE